MKNVLVQIAIVIGLLISSSQTVSAQWVQTDIPTNSTARDFIMDGSNIFVGTDTGVYLSTNNGTSWTAVNSGLTHKHVPALAVSGSNIFAGTYNGTVFLTNNNGTSWTPVNTGLPLNKSSITCLAVSGTGDIYASDYRNGIYLSINNGTSWTHVGPPRVMSLTVSGDYILAGDSSGNIYQTTKDWTDWHVVCRGFTTGVGSIVVNGSNIFASNGGYVFLSTDNGTSWDVANGGQNGIVTIECLAVSGSNIFAGTFLRGIYLSTNNGRSFTASDSIQIKCDSSAPWCKYIRSLFISGPYIFCGPHGAGVWRRPLSEMITVAIKNDKHPLSQISTCLNLTAATKIQSYVKINFSLTQSQPVTLKIYNISGREIATLVNRTLGVGEQRIYWNTKDVAEGCYAIKMQVGSNVYVKSIPVSQ